MNNVARFRPGDPEPFDALQKGDVILWNGRPRKVRDVKRYADDVRVWSVTFAIKGWSWTERPYTVYGRTELKQCFGGIVGSGVALCSFDEVECRVQREIETCKGANASNRVIYLREMLGKGIY